METNYPSSSKQASDSHAKFGKHGLDASEVRKGLMSLKSDLDDLVSRSASLTDQELYEARDHMWSKFGSTRSSMRTMVDQVKAQFNHGMHATTDRVKAHPLQSLTLAAGLGLVVGALMRGINAKGNSGAVDAASSPETLDPR